MKGLKIILWLFVSLMVGFLSFLVWYRYHFAMEVVAPYQINAPDLKTKLLIATQGSEFKEKVVSGIVDRYESSPIFIKIIDISGLEKVKPADFNAIVVLHTWENWKAPGEVTSFLSHTKKDRHKIVVLTTSGKGTYKMPDVDGISGESIVGKAPYYSSIIIKKLDSLLAMPKKIE